MRFSSISLIATALVAIAGSVTAAPAPRPFKRDVDIYSRGTPEEHAKAEDYHRQQASKYWEFSPKEAALHHKHREGHKNAKNGGKPHPLETQHPTEFMKQHQEAIARHEVSIHKSMSAAALTEFLNPERFKYHHDAVKKHQEYRDEHKATLEGGRVAHLQTTHLCDVTDKAADRDIETAKQLLKNDGHSIRV